MFYLAQLLSKQEATRHAWHNYIYTLGVNSER